MVPEHARALVEAAFDRFGQPAVFWGPYGAQPCVIRRRRGDAPVSAFTGVAAPVEQILVRVADVEEVRGGGFEIDGTLWAVQGDGRREQRHQLVWTCDVART